MTELGTAMNVVLLIEHGCEEGLAKRVVKQFEDKCAEVAALRNFTKELSDALLKVRPLGGSELFVRRAGEFYADPIYCGQDRKSVM